MYRMNCALLSALVFCFLLNVSAHSQPIGYELDSSTFVVEATTGADVIEFIAGTNLHVLWKNGVQQSIDAQLYSTILFEDGDTDDVFKINDSVRADGTFKSWHDKSEWTSGSQLVKAIGFGTVEATTNSGQNNRAYLYGTALEDALTGSIYQMQLVRSDGTVVAIANFDRIYPTVYEGNDLLNLTDSMDRDNVTSTEDYFKVDCPDVYFKGFNFEKTTFVCDQGGDDFLCMQLQSRSLNLRDLNTILRMFQFQVGRMIWRTWRCGL